MQRCLLKLLLLLMLLNSCQFNHRFCLGFLGFGVFFPRYFRPEWCSLAETFISACQAPKNSNLPCFICASGVTKQWDEFCTVLHSSKALQLCSPLVTLNRTLSHAQCHLVESWPSFQFIKIILNLNSGFENLVTLDGLMYTVNFTWVQSSLI